MPEDGPQRGPLVRAFSAVEDHLLAVVLAAMVVLPVIEICLRNAGYPGITGSIPMVSHLTLLVGMLGGAVAARDRRLLSLSSLTGALRGRWRTAAQIFAASFAVAVCAILAWTAGYFVLDERAAATVVVQGIPKWIVLLALPVGLGLIGLRQWWTTGEGLWSRTAIAVFGGALIALAYYQVVWFEDHPGPALLAVLVAAALGLPIFAILGGLTLILLTSVFEGPGLIPIEHYDLVTNPILPTLPLFTLAGYFLAEGGASKRLIEVFQALVGRMRGGPVIVTTLVCAFFTSFTGASGVTILALGGLLFPVLVAGGWSERTTLGLLTGAGSLGLLLAPCLPLILYAIVATNSLATIPLDAGGEMTMVSMENMFLAGLLPGLLLIVLTAVWAIRAGPRHDKSTLEPFDRRRALRALWAAKWELALPVVAITALFAGFATPVEAAALTAAYAFVIETFVYRDLHLGRDVPRVMAECGLLVGGVLLILSVAMGLTGYLILEQVPDRAVEWVTANIESRWVFLLALNGILILVGCLMDVFSAIVVVVPLIVPIGLAFGIDPVHLGIIFLANLELGYLTPPIGMNLFLASYRFKKPVPEVARAALPMLGVLAIGVLLITYVPFLSTFLPRWLG